MREEKKTTAKDSGKMKTLMSPTSIGDNQPCYHKTNNISQKKDNKYRLGGKRER